MVDANLNRSREGLRVCEDIARFVLNSKPLQVAFKSLRHKLKPAKVIPSLGIDFILARNARRDVGKKTRQADFARRDFLDLFSANAERVKESLRLLEEVSKLFDTASSEAFKRIRFRFYELEKGAFKKIKSMQNSSE